MRAAKTAQIIVVGCLVAVIVLALLSVVATLRPPAPGAEPERATDVRRFASPDLPLDQGLALVLFLAMDCPHCVETARMIATFDAAAHGLRVYFMLSGKPEEVEPFLQTLGTWPLYRLVPPGEFAEFVGDDPPAIYLLADGRLRAQWPGRRFNLAALVDELSRVH